jgi:hypothetical protein
VALTEHPGSVVQFNWTGPKINEKWVVTYGFFRARDGAARRHGEGHLQKTDSTRSVDVPAGNVAIGVDATIAEERPVRADHVEAVQIAFHQQRLFLIV